MLRTLYMILGVLSLAAFLLGPLLAQVGIVPGAAGFGIMALGCLFGVLAVVVELILLASRRGTKFTFVAAALGLVPAVFAVYGLAAGSRYPLINDISTNVEDPPQFADATALPENQGRDMAFPPDNGPIIRKRYPEMVSFTRADGPQTVYDRALNVARELGWTNIAEHSGGTAKTFEASAVSPVFRFHVDMVVRVSASDTGSTVDIRSKSREGKGDFGANAKRIAKFLERLEP